MFAAGPHWTDDEQRWEGEGMVVRAGSLAAGKRSPPLRIITRRSFAGLKTDD